MKKYAVILTCMTLGLSLSFAQNDPSADQSGAGAGAASSSDTSAQQESSSTTTSSEQSTQSSESTQSTEAERIVAEPAGAGQHKEVGTITLQGTVQTADEKKAIEDHLKTMSGVKKIENKLTVVGEISDPSGASTEEESGKAESEAPDSPESSESPQSSPDQSGQTP